MMKESDTRVVSRRQQQPQQQLQQQQPQQPLSAPSPSGAINGGSVELLPLHRQQQQQQQQQQPQQGLSSSQRTRRKSRERPFLSSGIMSTTLISGNMGHPSSSNNSNINSGISAPPRLSVGGLPAALSSFPESLDFFSVRDNKTNPSAKKSRRKYQVQTPCRLLTILALVFLIVPILIFMHKEVNIHHNQVAHYRTEKYIKVNTQEVFSTFGDVGAGGSTSSSDDPGSESATTEMGKNVTITEGAADSDGDEGTNELAASITTSNSTSTTKTTRTTTTADEEAPLIPDLKEDDTRTNSTTRRYRKR